MASMSQAWNGKAKSSFVRTIDMQDQMVSLGTGLGKWKLEPLSKQNLSVSWLVVLGTEESASVWSQDCSFE